MLMQNILQIFVFVITETTEMTCSPEEIEMIQSPMHYLVFYVPPCWECLHKSHRCILSAWYGG